MEKPVTGNFELIKNLNTSLVLGEIRRRGLVSRAEIARRTGLTPATVSNITAEMIRLGLVKERKRGDSSGGRRPVLLSISDGAFYCAAVHIGPRGVEAAVADVGAQILWRRQRLFPPGVTPDEALRMAAALIGEARRHTPEGRPLVGAGVCVHGLVRSEQGLLVFAPNLGWENVEVAGRLAAAAGLPVTVENDVRAMALAESWCGAARGVSDFVYLYVAEGIGGGIVMGGRLYKGVGGFAGEFGHITVEPDGPLCRCGNRGCLQAVASETSVVRSYCEAQRVPQNSVTFAEIVRRAQAGETAASDELMKSVRYLGIGVGTIVNSFSPSLIVLNGGIAGLGRMALEELRATAARHSLRDAASHVRIVFSPLGGEAPLRGAAACAVIELFRCPRRFLADGREKLASDGSSAT